MYAFNARVAGVFYSETDVAAGHGFNTEILY